MPHNHLLPEKIPTLQTLQAALLYMMSHYSAHTPACPCLAKAIAGHLRLFREHPDNAHCPMLQDTCSKLAVYWQDVACGAGSRSVPRQPSSNASPHPESTH